MWATVAIASGRHGLTMAARTHHGVCATVCAVVGIKGFLLGRVELCIKRFDSIATAVSLGCVLDAQGAHTVNALRGGELLRAFHAQTGMAGCVLHGSGELCPSAFLGWAELQLLFQLGVVLGAALLPACSGWIAAHSTVVAVVVLLVVTRLATLSAWARTGCCWRGGFGGWGCNCCGRTSASTSRL